MLKGFSVSRSAKALLATAAAAAVLSLPSTDADASCVPEPYIGSICATAASYCPRGYLSLRGTVLSIAQNQTLFSLLGCQFGGDCRTTFHLPDMRGRSPMGAGTGPGLSPIRLGEKHGFETVTLTLQNLPSHYHDATFTPGGGEPLSVKAFDGNGVSSTPSAENKHLQTVAANPFSPATDANLYGPGTGNPIDLEGVTGGTSPGGIVTVDHTGGHAPVSVGGPVVALTYCIADLGIYPPRPD